MSDSLRLGKMPFLAGYHPHKWRFSLRLSLSDAFATAAKAKPPSLAAPSACRVKELKT